ncbi:MAG: hypothetical protein V1921_00045 [Candidatus Altiarchaeota archaeon]
MWQLGIFDLGGSSVATYTGFSSGLRPQLAGTSLSSGDFTITLLNVGGTIVDVDSIQLTIDGTACGGTMTCTSGDDDNTAGLVACGTDINTPNNAHLQVHLTTWTTCVASTGNAVSADVTIGYTVQIGDLTVDKSAGGTIRTVVE